MLPEKATQETTESVFGLIFSVLEELSCTDAGGGAQWMLFFFYSVPKHLTHGFGMFL